MSRMIPHPFLSLALLGLWLLLNHVSLGHVVLGSAIALMAGKVFADLEPARLRLRNPKAMIKLFCFVFVDIIRSNIAVASLLLSKGRHGKRKSAFIEVHLQLRNPVALAVLAIILTSTPGTAWLEFDSDRGVLTLHVFDLIDVDEWQVVIRDRYEALLLEIFV